ncbi:molybdopterin synthase sulfur carrier subunit [Synechococcales cyanobacterium C]|uniref:Molybdopterin synthase sulfur carrier subunit n=1 Tax=Petrachloros mirabilis ULC683 TaxID=2781853 RepID=A0A8K1ZVE9_9CYAN|nr:MoaD/ThiS family protein [Petrachloros mirabilis]NCJ05910.1 molybdopterin synthase sulfur carrier subunit [Petrachloros mirabilis ULC683]
MSTIVVTVKLFAAYQDAYGVPEMQMELPAHTPVGAIADRCCQDHSHLNQWRPLTQFGINLDFVSPDTLLQDGDEVVLIPPVNGG